MGAQKDGSRWALNRDCRKSAVFIVSLLGSKLRIRCFNLFNVRTYRSEFTVAPLFMNSPSKIPSLYKKTLAMTLPAEVVALNLFSPTVIRSPDGYTRSDRFIEILCRNDHENRYKM